MINYNKYCGYIGHDIGARILTSPLAPIIMDLQKMYIEKTKQTNKQTLLSHDKRLKLF